MTALILTLLGKLWPYLLGAAALAFGALKVRQSTLNAERTRQAAKERDNYAKHLDELANAHIARNAVDGRLPDDDPYRRD